MNEGQFNYLLENVIPFIKKKKDTWFREALSPKIKLQMTQYLVTGDNMATLSTLYRIPRSTFSVFFPGIQLCGRFYNGSTNLTPYS